jgi:hypothetical protein
MVILQPKNGKTVLVVMKKNRILLAFLFLFIMFGGRAQTLVPNGPETEIEDGSRLTVMGEDEQYLYLCGVKKGWYDTDDDMYITVYDKQKQIIAVEHEIDEDYEFRTAYLRGEDVVLLGYKYNKKTKSVDYYESVFPIMEKKHKKLVLNTIYSVPAEGKKLATALILHLQDDNMTAFVTYTIPNNKKMDGYTLDLQVVDAEGNTLNHVQKEFADPSPYKVNGFLTNNGAVFIEEMAQSGTNVHWGVGMVAFSSGVVHRYLTVTAAGNVVPVELTDNSQEITNPKAGILPGKNDRFFIFGATKEGVATILVDEEGKLQGENFFETEKPSVPENISYETEMKDMGFVPGKVLSLQDGRIMVLAYRHLREMWSDGRAVHINNYYQNIYLYLFDSKGDLLSSTVLPFSCVDGGGNHQDIPVVFEWKDELWLLYNGNKKNYGSRKPSKWNMLVYTKPEPRCIVMGRLENDLNFEPKILYAPSNPAKTMSFGEYFDQIIKVTDDAVYFLMYRKSDNYIDKITE